MAPIRLFQPTADGLKRLWEQFDKHRAHFPDELPREPIDFVCWLAAEDVRVVEIGPAEAPVGVYVFTGIVPGVSAWAHPFVWDRDAYPPADLIAAARQACLALFQAFGLRRINGLTPTTHPHARIFAERVGFRVEGTLRAACVVKDAPVNAWISGLIPSDLAPAATMGSATHGAVGAGTAPSPASRPGKAGSTPDAATSER